MFWPLATHDVIRFWFFLPAFLLVFPVVCHIHHMFMAMLCAVGYTDHSVIPWPHTLSYTSTLWCNKLYRVKDFCLTMHHTRLILGPSELQGRVPTLLYKRGSNRDEFLPSSTQEAVTGVSSLPPIHGGQWQGWVPSLLCTGNCKKTTQNFQLYQLSS